MSNQTTPKPASISIEITWPELDGLLWMMETSRVRNTEVAHTRLRSLHGRLLKTKKRWSDQ